MVTIEGQSLLNDLKNYDEIHKLQELISQLPLIFFGETLFKGCLCLSETLVGNLIDIVIKVKDSIQKINVQMLQDMLVVKIVVKRKNNIYSCLLKIKNIEINIQKGEAIFHFHELPQFKTNNVFENFFIGFGAMVTKLNSGEEFIIKYLIGDRKGIVLNDHNLSIDLEKIPYLCEIYNKSILGLKFIDVVEIKDVHIKEGIVEVHWELIIPSTKKLNSE